MLGVCGMRSRKAANPGGYGCPPRRGFPLPSQQRIFLPSLCPWCLCGELFRHFHHEGTKGTKKTRPAGRWRYGERPFFVPQASRRPRPHPILCILCIHVKIPASGAFQTRCSQPSGPWPVCLRPVMLSIPQPFPSFPRKREPILGQRVAPRVEGMAPRFRGGDGRGGRECLVAAFPVAVFGRPPPEK